VKRFILALTTIAAPLAAQGTVQTVRGQWMEAHNYVLRSAQMVPDSVLGFKPTPVVRSIGQIAGHVAASEMSYCAAVLGEPAQDEDALEKKATTKAAIVALLNDSQKYCERAYAISDADAAKTIKIFGRDRTRLYGLVENATHDWEHYGNLITYLRIKGMVPPSSQ
jgi:uncharacterized damage-inducible protein DinB